MTWDLYVADILESFLTTNDIPKGWRPPVIGTAYEVIDKIRMGFNRAPTP